MADKKITDLPALATATANDLLPIVDDTGVVTKKVSVTGLATGLGPLMPNAFLSNAMLSTAAGQPGAGWTTYTPAFTSSIGTPTTVTTNKARYQTVGKSVSLRLDFTVTTVGTAAGHLEFTLPVTALDIGHTGASAEFAVAGIAGQVWAKSTTKAALTKYDGQSAWIANYRWLVSMVYEAA